MANRVTLAALLIAACGTPHPSQHVQPVESELEQAVEGDDAGVEIEIDARVDADFSFLYTDADLADAPWEQGEGAVAASVEVDARVDDDLAEFYDNGVRIVPTRRRPACGKSKGFGVCGFDAAMCRAIAKGCTAATNIACFSGRSRTDGSETPFCTPTYGVCMKLRYAAEISEEYDVPDECMLFRYAPKRGKK